MHRLEPCDAVCVLVADHQDQTDGAVKERATPKTKQQEPTLYKVVLLNDDYTTMDFVIHVLEEVFQKSPAEAFRIMMQVHVNGRGIAGRVSLGSGRNQSRDGLDDGA